MSLGLEQLHSARTDVQHVHQTLENVCEELASTSDAFQSLQLLQKVALEHDQLGSVVGALPRLFSGEASPVRLVNMADIPMHYLLFGLPPLGGLGAA